MCSATWGSPRVGQEAEGAGESQGKSLYCQRRLISKAPE